MKCFDTVHEMLIHAYNTILSSGEVSEPRGIKTREILGESFRVLYPRNRLYIRPGKRMSLPFAIGEFLWYIRKSNSLDEITYYSRTMPNYSDDSKTLNSAYGSRIWGVHKYIKHNQWNLAKQMLLSDKDSRQAVIHIRVPEDFVFASKDHPCTLTMHFLLRNNRLNLLVNMRSNDLFKGSCYDIFSFTMFQEMMAWELGVQLGFYQHTVGSWHLYEKDINNSIIPIGTPKPMPEFSFREDDVRRILSIEKEYRIHNKIDINAIALPNCWYDWVMILNSFALGIDIPYNQINECYSSITR